MADLDVQRKKRPAWIWVIPLILLIAAVWAILSITERRAADGMDGEAGPSAIPDSLVEDAEPGPDGPVVAAGVLPAVAEYNGECGSVDDAREQMSPEHDFEAECIRLLTVALSSVVQRDTIGRVLLEERLEDYRQLADSLESTSAESPDHSARFQQVAVSAAGLMRLVSETRPNPVPGLSQAVDRVEQAAAQIDTATPLLDQKEATGEFFRSAGEALELFGEKEP